MQRRSSKQSGSGREHSLAPENGRPSLRSHEDPDLSLLQELPNMVLLCVLYMMQGVPLGLTMGSMPFILASKASYTQIGIFSIAGYPYSFKLLWSPLVDSVYSSSFGRRKTWIVPLQLASAALMIAFAPWANERLEAADVRSITLLFFFLVLLAATQDIAVDGWALTLLSRRHVGYAATCQTVGMNVGYFASFTVFLALNDADFCNAYFRPPDGASERGLLSLSAYLTTWGAVYIVVTLAVWLLKKERYHAHSAPRHEARDPSLPLLDRSGPGEARLEGVDEEDVGIREAYRQLWGVVKLPAVRRLAFVLVTSRLAMLPAESAAPLKLLEKGVSKEALAGLVLLEFPCELISAVLAGRWAASASPFAPWQVGYSVRLAMAACTTLLVLYFPSNASSLAAHPLEFFALAAVGLLTSFTSTLMFTAMGAFYNRISDPAMGGAYLTLLNTIANMGIILPKLAMFALIDALSHNVCTSSDGVDVEFECPRNIQAARQPGNDCTANGGICQVARDGFYIASFASIGLGVLLLLHYRRFVSTLDALPVESWRDKSLHHRS